MIRVKICGLTRLEDSCWANRLIPDYVGFVFAPSRRRIDPKKAGEIARVLDPKIKKVGVFVNPLLGEIDKVLKYCPLDIVQLHGEETPGFCLKVPVKVWKAFRMSGVDVLSDVVKYNVEAFLFDGYNPGGYGGMNKTFPWEWVNCINTCNTPIILAGGLDCNNVVKAVSIARPFAVDVSSGVEANRVKDPAKIENFIRKVRELNE